MHLPTGKEGGDVLDKPHHDGGLALSRAPSRLRGHRRVLHCLLLCCRNAPGAIRRHRGCRSAI